MNRGIMIPVRCHFCPKEVMAHLPAGSSFPTLRVGWLALYAEHRVPKAEGFPEINSETGKLTGAIGFVRAARYEACPDCHGKALERIGEFVNGIELSDQPLFPGGEPKA